MDGLRKWKKELALVGCVGVGVAVLYTLYRTSSSSGRVAVDDIPNKITNSDSEETSASQKDSNASLELAAAPPRKHAEVSKDEAQHVSAPAATTHAAPGREVRPTAELVRIPPIEIKALLLTSDPIDFAEGLQAMLLQSAYSPLQDVHRAMGNLDRVCGIAADSSANAKQRVVCFQIAANYATRFDNHATLQSSGILDSFVLHMASMLGLPVSGKGVGAGAASAGAEQVAQDEDAGTVHVATSALRLCLNLSCTDEGCVAMLGSGKQLLQRQQQQQEDADILSVLWSAAGIGRRRVGGDAATLAGLQLPALKVLFNISCSPLHLLPLKLSWQRAEAAGSAGDRGGSTAAAAAGGAVGSDSPRGHWTEEERKVLVNLLQKLQKVE